LNGCQKEWFLNIDKIYQDQQSKGVTQLILKQVLDLKTTLENYKSHESRKEILTMHLTQTLDEIRFWLDRGLTILASIGSIAPFVGLFGTVWGIYHALSKISAQGSVGLNVVAGPIAEALIATAIGLATAIPAVLAYNSFVRFNRLLIQNLRHLAEQITVYLSNQNL
jgi:biopolymer transport protein ExbB